MAKYIVTSPSGDEYEINAPDDASEEQVMSYAKQQFSNQGSQSKAVEPQTVEKTLADRANSVAENAMAKQLPLVKMLSNIPSTSRAAAKDVGNMIMHPIETAKGVGSLAQGAYQKFTPGVQDKEMYVDQAINRMKDRYGSIDKINTTLQNDPGGAFLDLAPIGPGVGVAKTIAKAPLKAVPQSAARKLYNSAAKFSTTMDDAKRTRLIDTALKNKINPSPLSDPVGRLATLSDTVGAKIDSLIDNAAKSGGKVHKSVVFRDIKALKKEFGDMNPSAKADLSSIDNIVSNMDAQFKTYVPIKDLQKLKRKLNKDIKWDRKAHTSTPVKEATYRAMERGARTGIEALAPDVKGLNKEWGKLIELQDPIKQASHRIGNRDLLGLRTPMNVGIGAAAAGPHGAAAGLALSAMESPYAKAALAIQLDAVRRQNLISALMRNASGVGAGAAYQNEKLNQENR